MHIPDRIIEIGGADRPVVPRRVREYLGIDPQYGNRVCRERTKAALEIWDVCATLLGEYIEKVPIDSVAPSELVLMRNVLGNKVGDRINTVRSALGFVSRGGVLVVLEDITAAQARLDEVEAAMEQEGHWAAVFGAAQNTFKNISEDLGLIEPSLPHKLLLVRPEADPFRAIAGELT